MWLIINFKENKAIHHITQLLFICMTIAWSAFSIMLVYTPWRRQRNALGAPCALCARRRCTVTTLCTPRARHERFVKTPWERGGTPWALLGNPTVAVGAPWHLHVIKNVKLFAIFSSIFVRSHGALRNFKSPCQRRGIAVECDRGLRWNVGQLHWPLRRNGVA